MSDELKNLPGGVAGIQTDWSMTWYGYLTPAEVAKHHGVSVGDDLYTAKQMREYAMANVQAALQQQGEAVASEDAAFGWFVETLPPKPYQCVFTRAPEIVAMQGSVERGEVKATPLYADPPKPVVSDAADDKILWGIVANAGRLSNKRMARWAHVSDATGQGSSSSAELCRRFGFDPDAEVGGDNLDAFLAEMEAELVVSDEVQELIVDAFMAGNQRGHESTVEGYWSDDRDIGHEYAVELGVKS